MLELFAVFMNVQSFKVKEGGSWFLGDLVYNFVNRENLFQRVSEKQERMKIAFCRGLALSAGLKVGGGPGMRVGCYPFT